MRTGKQLILAMKAYAVDNPGKSWWCIISTGLLLVTSITGTFLNIPLVARVACSVFAGLLFLRMFVIYHDHQHHAILPKSRLANLLLTAFGILSLCPSSVWRGSHNHHHNHNSKLRGSHIGSFPVMTKALFLTSGTGRRLKYLFMRHPLTILCGYFFVFFFGMCVYPAFNEPRKHLDCLFAAVFHVIAVAAIVFLFGWLTLVLGLLIPCFISGAIGSYLFYAQHNFPGVSFHDNAGWTYEKAALESSSLMKTGPLMGWFTGNIGYHHIHHLNAAIPFYRLPEVSRKMPELRSPKTTSLNPVEIMRCLQLKVWDVELQRMVGIGLMASQ